jgi:hypothetical protein
MVMLIADDAEQLDAVLKAWESIHVDDAVFVDSTFFHRSGRDRPHIPMRFMFERLDRGQRQSSVTLFGIVNGEAMVHECIAQAETVMGDLDTAENAMLVAWPLPIAKGLPQQGRRQGDDVE